MKGFFRDLNDVKRVSPRYIYCLLIEFFDARKPRGLWLNISWSNWQ
jgi:hypothetical protein